ncbi:MAG: UbiX family flavin prenyltransferase, partial [Microvirga sp.]
MIVGITGATGIIYGVRLLEALKELGIERHLVLSKAAEITRAYETSFGAADIRALADFAYSPNDIGAPIASGSFKTMGMIVAPCSIRTLSDIAHGTTSGLISRA